MDLILRVLLGFLLFGFVGWLGLLIWNLFEVALAAIGTAIGKSLRNLLGLNRRWNKCWTVALYAVLFGKNVAGSAYVFSLILYCFLAPTWLTVATGLSVIAAAVQLFIWLPGIIGMNLFGPGLLGSDEVEDADESTGSTPPGPKRGTSGRLTARIASLVVFAALTLGVGVWIGAGSGASNGDTDADRASSEREASATARSASRSQNRTATVTKRQTSTASVPTATRTPAPKPTATPVAAVEIVEPRFDPVAGRCGPHPDSVLARVWQVSAPREFDRTNEGESLRLGLRNKFGENGEAHAVRVRVITPSGQTHASEFGIVEADSFLYVNYPGDFPSASPPTTGTYTALWETSAGFIACDGFEVNPTPIDVQSYSFTTPTEAVAFALDSLDLQRSYSGACHDRSPIGTYCSFTQDRADGLLIMSIGLDRASVLAGTVILRENNASYQLLGFDVARYIGAGRYTVSGAVDCLNSRSSPGISGALVRCLPENSMVSTTGVFAWVDGFIWLETSEGTWIAGRWLCLPIFCPNPTVPTDTVVFGE